MSYQWKAEQTIEPSMALRLIQEQFPELCAKIFASWEWAGIIPLLSSMKTLSFDFLAGKLPGLY